jgi:hypothetical protein
MSDGWIVDLYDSVADRATGVAWPTAAGFLGLFL